MGDYLLDARLKNDRMETYGGHGFCAFLRSAVITGWRRIMPSRQSVLFEGYLIEMEPNFWLRRWLRFPFYFESHNPSFRMRAKRISENPQVGDIPLLLIYSFPDGSHEHELFKFPPTPIGAKLLFTTKEIMTPKPGQTKIQLMSAFTGQPLGEHTHLNWLNLYSYRVRREEDLWLTIAAMLLALLGGGIANWLLDKFLH
jgi:hypothetical protein